MAAAYSTFTGVIVIDQLSFEACAKLPAELDVPSELRRALYCLAGEFPIDSLEAEQDEQPAPARTSALDRPPRYLGADIRRRSTVCVAARLECLRAELDAEAGALLKKIELAKIA